MVTKIHLVALSCSKMVLSFADTLPVILPAPPSQRLDMLDWSAAKELNTSSSLVFELLMEFVFLVRFSEILSKRDDNNFSTLPSLLLLAYFFIFPSIVFNLFENFLLMHLIWSGFFLQFVLGFFFFFSFLLFLRPLTMCLLFLVYP